jgi:UDP-N-acetylmuramoyl-tripeptide--D-alanyl-D-alanine ligase
MNLSILADVVGGTLYGADVAFSGLSTDTRNIQPANVFLALTGERFDGNEFVSQAVAAGAVAAVTARRVDADIPQVVVADTRIALGQWAKYSASQYRVPRIAVTGSCGKTSVKEMMASIMQQRGHVLATSGNLNNDIGVPLTLLRLDASHTSAVLELGANHMGEIEYTCALVEPDVALITNVGEAHLEGFGSRDNISRAKGEIYGGLREGGTAVINADDAYADYWRTLNLGRRVRTFSLRDRNADVHLLEFTLDSTGRPSFVASVDGRRLAVSLQVLGEHQVVNALAAIAATTALGVDDTAVVTGLESLAPIKGRMYPRQLGGWDWVEDSYNANPSSMKAGLAFLAELPEPKVAILGGMGELGEGAAQMHVDVGEFAARSGLRRLIAVGPAAVHYARGFAGVGRDVFEVASHAEAAVCLLQRMPAGRVLVKGSRSARMENVFEEAARLLQTGD